MISHVPPQFFHTSTTSGSTPAATQRVLVADDDPGIRHLLELTLRSKGYEVLSANNGHELVRVAQDSTPHIILVDLMMPQMDGYEAIRQLRNDTRTAHIPMLILTALTRKEDIVVGFQSGADDYIVKPFDIPELLARVDSHLRREARRLMHNPLTRLPGNPLLNEALRHRLAQPEPLALIYADLDNFKAFNDTYGFSRGDRAILLLADILRQAIAAAGSSDDFIGHIGGDDFALLTTPDRIDPICRYIITSFDRDVRQMYDTSDRERGYLSGADRYGVLRRFGLMTISLGVVTTDRRTFQDAEALARVAAEMKHFAKEQNIGKSHYAVDQRGLAQNPEVERRYTQRRRVLLATGDDSLRTVLRGALNERGYLTSETLNVEQLRQYLRESDPPSVVLADAALGEPLWAFCRELTTTKVATPIMVLAADGHEAQAATAARVAGCITQPVPLADIVALLDRLIDEQPLPTARILGS